MASAPGPPERRNIMTGIAELHAQTRFLAMLGRSELFSLP
jgi:hypothetical protein